VFQFTRFQTCSVLKSKEKINNFETRAEFVLAGTKGQGDESGGRILLDGNTGCG
jgi:hypothetical protein